MASLFVLYLEHLISNLLRLLKRAPRILSSSISLRLGRLIAGRNLQSQSFTITKTITISSLLILLSLLPTRSTVSQLPYILLSLLHRPLRSIRRSLLRLSQRARTVPLPRNLSQLFPSLSLFKHRIRTRLSILLPLRDQFLEAKETDPVSQ